MSSSSDHNDEWRRPSPRWGVGPAALLLPILSALWIGLWVHGRDGGSIPKARQTLADVERELGAWVGSAALADGRGIDVRLSPLQAEARRQEFDREALAQRFGLGTGEPWRLELSLSHSGAPAPSVSIDGAQIRVDDRSGEVSRALRREQQGRADPLLVLFSPASDASIGSGQSMQFVLWGRAPNVGGVRLHGLRVDGGDVEVALSPLDLRETDLPASVARRDVEEEPGQGEGRGSGRGSDRSVR